MDTFDFNALAGVHGRHTICRVVSARGSRNDAGGGPVATLAVHMRRPDMTLQQFYQISVMQSPYNDMTPWHCQQSIAAWLKWMFR